MTVKPPYIVYKGNSRQPLVYAPCSLFRNACENQSLAELNNQCLMK